MTAPLGLLRVRLQGDDLETLKYVVAEVLGPFSERAMIVRAFRNCKLHADIVGQLCAEIRRNAPEGTFVRCLGGGTVTRDDNERTVTLKGFSHDFGSEPDRVLTARLIAEDMPGFTVVQE